MIRRDVTSPNGSRHWALVSQVEHARLGGELASRWGSSAVPPVICSPGGSLASVRQEALAAMSHHDDGWAPWEAAPEIDPAHGRPFSFLDIPMEESLAIWSASVATAEEIGPLAAWMVAGHFVALLSESDSAAEPVALTWLVEMDQRRAVWLREWTSLDRDCHTPERAGEALGWLQLFDQFSLWLCCTMPTVGDHSSGSALGQPIAIPGGGQLLLECGAQTPRQIVVEPWPFSEDRLQVGVSGSIVPEKGYQSTTELLEARRPLELRWEMVET